METLKCHSNESTWATTIKNIIYVEANVLRRRFLYILFQNLAFRLPWQPIIISDLDKIYTVGRGLIQKHFCKIFVKISAATQK